MKMIYLAASRHRKLPSNDASQTKHVKIRLARRRRTMEKARFRKKTLTRYKRLSDSCRPISSKQL